MTMSNVEQTRIVESRWGLAALATSLVPIATLLAVIVAAALGVKDSQGKAYVYFFTFGALMIASPIALICATIGLVGSGRKRACIAASGLICLGWLVLLGFSIFNH